MSETRSFGLGLFASFSQLASLSGSADQLIAPRAAMRIGAACVFPGPRLPTRFFEL